MIFAVSSIANLTPPVDWQNADKLSHLIEYTLLGLLLARAFAGSRVLPSLAACLLLATITGFVTGACDELYQIHVPGRVSSHLDYVADALGILIGQAFYALVSGSRFSRG